MRGGEDDSIGILVESPRQLDAGKIDTDSPSFKKPRPPIYIPIAAVIIVVVLISAIIWHPQTKNEQPHWALQSGDFLEYSVSGFNNTASISGTARLNITTYTESMLATSAEAHVALPDSLVSEWASIAVDRGHYGFPIGRENISTIYGAKSVNKYLHYSHNSMIVSYVGPESLVTYRMNASCFGCFLTFDLSNTSATKIKGMDTTMDAKPDELLSTVVEGTSTEIVPQWIMDFGVINLKVGGEFRCNVTGQNASFYFFSSDDIEKMERGGFFGYNETLSIPTGNGSMNATLHAGVYLYVMDTISMTSGQAMYVFYLKPY